MVTGKGNPLGITYLNNMSIYRTHCIKEVWFKSGLPGVSRAIELYSADRYKRNAAKVSVLVCMLLSTDVTCRLRRVYSLY